MNLRFRVSVLYIHRFGPRGMHRDMNMVYRFNLLKTEMVYFSSSLDFDLICSVYIPGLFSKDSQDKLNAPIKMHDTLDENENN